jgi:hypothetical protein
MSGKSTATSSILLRLEYLRRNAPRADLASLSTVNHEADFALAIIGDRLRIVGRLPTRKYFLAASS